jgi:pilus assembly protein Flp/PilA
VPHQMSGPPFPIGRPSSCARANRNRAAAGRERKKEYTRMKALLRNLVVREEGQDLVEYALLAALLSIVSIVALQTLGPTISAVWDRINTAISTANA